MQVKKWEGSVDGMIKLKSFLEYVISLCVIILIFGLVVWIWKGAVGLKIAATSLIILTPSQYLWEFIKKDMEGE